ncbi:low molecular weight protein-tyrosine-phosphatase [uncultured Dialister sp.]|uniref:low molecular weight protein-tyrosine-phosphatase n=1 Tax=uncultured Dialister sp. TaxID=278064 RepID=UPI0027DE702F|nr:low molecular weight protein-tyrosine-phosphatase [uncultured Dialister sp.]
MSMIRILFICHGNICRSPMAEMVMKEMVRQKGLEAKFEISSMAATTEEIGQDMYPPAKRALTAHRIPYTKRKAALITMKDYDWADYIIAMDEENMHDLSRLTRGDPDKKISRLLYWAGEKRDVADPWYTGNFEKTYEDIVKGCRAVLEKLS